MGVGTRMHPDRFISWLISRIKGEFGGDADMDSKTSDEIVEELSSTLQRIDTQSAAVLEFIKAKGLATDDELAPYLQRAAAASNVRWRAVRVRVEYLLAGREKNEIHAEEEKAEDPGSSGGEQEVKVPDQGDKQPNAA